MLTKLIFISQMMRFCYNHSLLSIWFQHMNRWRGSIRGYPIFVSITRKGLGFDKIWIHFSPNKHLHALHMEYSQNLKCISDDGGWSFLCSFHKEKFKTFWHLRSSRLSIIIKIRRGTAPAKGTSLNYPACTSINASSDSAFSYHITTNRSTVVFITQTLVLQHIGLYYQSYAFPKYISNTTQIKGFWTLQ